jgi:hypothetical protein
LPRPYLDLEGWPFDVAELDRYTRDIESLMGVDHESYEEDASSHLDPDSMLNRNDQDFVLRCPRGPRWKITTWRTFCATRSRNSTISRFGWARPLRGSRLIQPLAKSLRCAPPTTPGRS